ncbi:hypothetical protein BAY50_24555 [Klebsiella pneumoniae]|nr:hypothetical protein BAY50_24555 [Klebsiella pneumoniae]RDG55680.1 hypothetical protein DWA43_26835 [Klebsiella pneumoniae]RDG69292.1 hypothetical protein DWA40_27255 [Klebsiella pneumoniae]
MTRLIHFEYAPPRSWEQFEELCADLFEAMWSDPNIVIHGRAGQEKMESILLLQEEAFIQ